MSADVNPLAVVTRRSRRRKRVGVLQSSQPAQADLKKREVCHPLAASCGRETMRAVSICIVRRGLE